MSLPWFKGAICLLRKSGKTLFVDYRDYPHKIHQGKYSPPGGTFDQLKDSNLEETAIREVLEEVNITAKNLVYRGKVHFNNERRTVNGKPMKINMSVDIFDCYDFDDSNACPMEEKEGKKTRLKWIPDSDILNVKEMHEGDRKMFEWLRDYKEFEGEIIEVGENLESFILSNQVKF